MDVGNTPSDFPCPRVNHTKSGAIIAEPDAKGLYHMYFGESFIYHATSSNMLDWTPSPSTEYFAAPIFPWESRLIEPGPAPIKTRDGKWIFIYNGSADGRAGYKRGQYSTGQMLIDPNFTVGPDKRHGPIARMETPILVPDRPNELEGLVNQVVFTEGLVQFKGKWYLYFGESKQAPVNRLLTFPQVRQTPSWVLPLPMSCLDHAWTLNLSLSCLRAVTKRLVSRDHAQSLDLTRDVEIDER